MWTIENLRNKEVCLHATRFNIERREIINDYLLRHTHGKDIINRTFEMNGDRAEKQRMLSEDRQAQLDAEIYADNILQLIVDVRNFSNHPFPDK